MPISASYLGSTDDWTRTYLANRGYTPECGNIECRDGDCALRDRDGYDYEGYDAEGYDRNGYDYNGQDAAGNSRCDNGDCSCYDHDDEPEREYDARLHSYSYRPSLKFNGDAAPWYGMELEVTTDAISSALDIMENAAPKLIYGKEDSSVQGLEIVTHPMSYPWAMEHFPWEMLTELRGSGATTVASDNGIHVHVGRDGFSNPAHMFRWLKFWYRNPSDMQRIARRRSSWGDFSASHRAAHKEHVKAGKPSYRRSYDETIHQRYAAINTSNDDTLEVRVFASTLRPQRAQAALQLVAGSVEYARQLTPEAITKRHGWEWPAFISWAGKSGDYNALMAENRLRRYL